MGGWLLRLWLFCCFVFLSQSFLSARFAWLLLTVGHVVGGALTLLLQVAVMNSLSVNLHMLMVAFYRPTPKRFKILMEAQAFCSDHHVIRSQLRWHGYDEKAALICMQPRAGETYIRTEDILSTIDREVR